MSRIRTMGEPVFTVGAYGIAVLAGAIPCLALLFWLFTIEELTWWIAFPAIFGAIFGASVIAVTTLAGLDRVVKSRLANRRTK